MYFMQDDDLSDGNSSDFSGQPLPNIRDQLRHLTDNNDNNDDGSVLIIRRLPRSRPGPVEGVSYIEENSNRVTMLPAGRTVTYYDRNLTPIHKYLGDGMKETTGRTIFECGVIHTIPIIFLKVNLIPGQILPIIARSSNVKFILRYALARNGVFGVSYKLNENGRTFGTIAEIYEQSEGDITRAQSFRIKAMIHQRYRLISIQEFPESHERMTIGLGQIKIIPDITLTNPYNKLCLNPKKRNLHHSEKCRKRDMWQTQWPDWVYKQFDVNLLASRIADKVKMLYKDVRIADDPCLLSFQMTKLGIFNQEQINYLMGIESTNLRLQYELDYWNKNTLLQKFMCSRPNCGIPICNMSSVFQMSPEGPQGTYCNSWGQIHDMITVTELDKDISVVSIGSPSTECSWFPGYKWLIILCPNCHGHLGWRYVADDNVSLIPKLFYGLTIRSITSTNNYLERNQYGGGVDGYNDGTMLVAV